MDYREKTEKSPTHGDTWGDWKYDAGHHALVEQNQGYEVDLLRFTTSAGALDLVFQAAGKTWATPVRIGNLIQAIDDLTAPQATLCSGGRDKTFNVKTYLSALADQAR